MYDYDYGMTVEDLEFSEDFYVKIDEVIKKEIKGILEENKKLSDENRNVNKKIFDARNVLQEEIKQLEEENKKKEKEIDELKKTLGSIKFSIDDEVYIINSRSEKNTCLKCSWKRKVIVKHENEELKIDCPACNGYGYDGYKTIYYVEKKYIAALEISKNNVLYGYKNGFDSYNYKEETIFFKTEEEAREECEKLNKKSDEEE